MDNAIAGVRVLIVEDEPLVGIMLEDMLHELGVHVAATATALDEALLLADDPDFDAAVLDVNLAGAGSYPVADKLRERGIPFVFATGYDSRVLAENYQADPLIHKPYTLKDVQRALSEMMCIG